MDAVLPRQPCEPGREAGARHSSALRLQRAAVRAESAAEPEFLQLVQKLQVEPLECSRTRRRYALRKGGPVSTSTDEELKYFCITI